MGDRRKVDELSLSELEEALYRKKYTQRRQRLRRLKNAGRIVEIAGHPPPNPDPPPLLPPLPNATGALRRYTLNHDAPLPASPPANAARRLNLRWVFDKTLVLVEIGAFFAFLFLVFNFLDTRQELNQELAQLQNQQSQELALPTATPTPIIGVAILPGGHKPPIEGRPPEQGEAGTIPDHLLPIINAYVPPPIPTPGPEQARRIQIPTLNIDKPIVQGDDWEQLKKGVGQHIGSTQPGQTGNLVLSAHNDIYGEIFRHLDKLKRGDEIIISTERQSYRYIVRQIDVVLPTDVSVMAATTYPSVTLISCYPYLVNDKRIVVYADLAGPVGDTG
ncbi:MAG: class D sortase [Anaerolineales bacterium]|nr:class D sortase [Anaerolineales bacterium]MCB8950990.1 class D sortase [Ardenticatenales bacterium]